MSNIIFSHLILSNCFIHSFDTDSLSIHYMPGANLGAYNAVLRRIEKIPLLLGLNFKGRHNNYVNKLIVMYIR